MSLLSLAGGLAILLYGMQLSGEGLQRAAGGQLRHLLTSMTRTRFSAVAAGALVTALIQSSSATTLMLIGFVSAGLMTFRQSLGVILGADIGTTFTVQLLAFNLRDLAFALLAVGFGLALFGRGGLVKNVGQLFFVVRRTVPEQDRMAAAHDHDRRRLGRDIHDQPVAGGHVR